MGKKSESELLTQVTRGSELVRQGLVWEIRSNPDTFNQVWLWMANDNKLLSWRSAWMIDLASEQSPSLLANRIPEVVAWLITTDNPSLRRHMARILTRYPIPQEEEGVVINSCFKLLNPREPVAVRVHALQILFNLTQKYPELKSEVALTLHGMMEQESSAGFANRAKKVLKQLA